MIFIPPWDVDSNWVDYADRLAPALGRQTAFDEAGIKSMLTQGNMHLWDAGHAVLVTQIQAFQLERVCVIVMCAGRDMESWSDEAWAVICRYAGHHGCKAIQVYGRAGWSRARPELKVVETVMRAEL